MTEPDRAEWTKYADEYGGNPVFWINQTNAPQLQAANLDGVCFAITMDWVDNYRTSMIARRNFINRFRDVQSEDVPKRFPAIYVEKQQAYKATLDAQNDAVRQILGMLKTATDSTNPSRTELLAIKSRLQKNAYGRSLGTFSKINDDIFGFDTAVNALKAAAAQSPGYFMLSFSTPGVGGHVVGFEARPDMYVSTNYPQLHEFIDANLGLYAFSDFDKMMSFFVDKVWYENYEHKGYSKYELAQFDRGDVRVDNSA